MAETVQNVFRCPMLECNFISSTPVEWLAHLRRIDHQQQFNISCCIEGCSSSESFVTFAAIKSHIYRKHIGIRKRHNVDQDDATVDVDTCTDFATGIDDDTEADMNRLLGTDLQQQKRESALFIMKMKEVRRLSQVSVDAVILGSKALFDSTVTRLQAGVRQKLSQIGVDAQVADEVFHELKDPFTGLETEYLQSKYITKEFNIVVSILT